MYVLHRQHLFFASRRTLVHLWRWLSGEAHHGHPITDAGWFRHGQKALTRTGYATRWWHLPRWKRAAWRTGGTLAVVMWTAALVRNWRATVIATASVLFAAIVLAVWLLVRHILARHRRRTWLHPLHLAAHELAGHPRAIRAESWIKAELESGGGVRKATLALPPGWPADEKDKQRLASIASAKLGIEAPEPSWRNAGPKPVLILTRSEPPPRWVEYADIKKAIEQARPDEFVCGIGKRDQIVKASLTGDSPHLAINMGTGAGKSSLASFWVMQVLRRGAVAMVLDYKWHSLPWLFKDEEGEYDYLPNVAYLSSPEQIHDGLCWLGDELDRRNQVTRRAVTAASQMRGRVGPPIFVVAEELNFVMPKLKEHWTAIREPDQPKKSPALTALGAVTYAGRAVDMHGIFIGQMITAEVTGSKDNSVKENIGIKAMARYGVSGWGTMVGRDVPMPPSPSVLGRIQLVTASAVRETQTPVPDGVLYRELVLAGDMTPCPPGMPGARRAPAVLGQSPLSLNPGPDVGIVPGTSPPLGQPGSRVILSEAVLLGISPRSIEALRRASTREQGFPPKVGQRGQAAEYDAVTLAEYEAARR